MWGASIPTIYYGFYCDSELQKFYWIMVFIFVCSVPFISRSLDMLLLSLLRFTPDFRGFTWLCHIYHEPPIL